MVRRNAYGISFEDGRILPCRSRRAAIELAECYVSSTAESTEVMLLRRPVEQPRWTAFDLIQTMDISRSGSLRASGGSGRGPMRIAGASDHGGRTEVLPPSHHGKGREG